tara:strand:- start:96 stop:260 length:165 start_codon:yes stop_codon:yes gene_type:complete
LLNEYDETNSTHRYVQKDNKLTWLKNEKALKKYRNTVRKLLVEDYLQAIVMLTK